jgi:hypothetical protein
MGDKHIDYTYYNTLTTKSSPSTFEFHGKLNTPNVVLTTGSRTKQYISRIVSISEPNETNFDGELVIEHTLATNYGKKMLLIFPLKTDETIKPNIIDMMILANPGDSLEVNLNTVIAPQDSCRYKDENNIAIFATPILIATRITKKNEPIIEGFPDCPNSGSGGGKGGGSPADWASVQARLDAVEKHVKLGGPTHGGSGSGSGSYDNNMSMTQNMLNDLLSGNGLQCDALPSGEESNNYIAKLLDVNVDSNKEKLDITNPVAYSLASIIMACVTYFAITSGYRKLFVWLQYTNHNDAEPSLKSLHMYEGAVGFLLLFFVVIFLVDTPIRSVAIAGLLLCLWFIYTVVLGVSKKSIIVDVAGSSYELDDMIKRIMKTMLYNMFLFYPLFPLILGFEKAKQWFS